MSKTSAGDGVLLKKTKKSAGLNKFQYSLRTTCCISFLLNNTLTMTDVSEVQKHVLFIKTFIFKTVLTAS